MLDTCMNINVSTLIIKMSQDYNLHFYFYNLDGNKSNFDTLAGELHRFGDKFSFIGLAETNVDSEHKDLYKLKNYNNFYTDRLPNKSSGTGIALYVHDSFSVKVLQYLNVGVFYRPPNSVSKDFIGELERVIKLLPKNLTFLMGDFNINLLKIASDTEVQSFENIFYQKDYILASPLQRISVLLRKKHALIIFYATRLRLFNTLVSYQTKGHSTHQFFLYPTLTLTDPVTQKSNIHSITASLRKILIGYLSFFK